MGDVPLIEIDFFKISTIPGWLESGFHPQAFLLFPEWDLAPLPRTFFIPVFNLVERFPDFLAPRCLLSSNGRSFAPPDFI